MPRPIIGLVEDITISYKNKQATVKARIDSGATASSLDLNLAEQLDITPGERSRIVKSASGVNRRPLIRATIIIHGITLRGDFTLADRSHMKYQMLVGQNILKAGEFLIDPLK